MSIRTILFDLDGTLINTNELIVASFNYTFDKYGLTFTEEEIMSFNGPPLKETFKKIDQARKKAMLQTYREHNLLHHDDYVTMYPNVMETIKQLKDKQVKLGIVTTKMKKGAMMGLDLTNLTPFFDSIITFDDIVHAKPHPEPVLKGMEQLQGKAESTLMVGDNFHDIEAGKRAGVRTAGVAWADKGREYLEAYNPTYMLEDMLDVLKLVD